MEQDTPRNGPSRTSPETDSSPYSKPTTTTTNNNNKEQDRFLPIANVGRIMKKVVPGNGKISKDAKETVQECVSEFISFVTGEASDKCQREKRKTINGDDIIWAITTLGFEDYINPLKSYLNKYREVETEKLNVPKHHHHHHQQQQQQQRLQQYHQELHQEHDLNLPYKGHHVYSSAGLVSHHHHNYNHNHHQGFVGEDQKFPLPFAPASIHKPLKQDQIDSVGHW